MDILIKDKSNKTQEIKYNPSKLKILTPVEKTLKTIYYDNLNFDNANVLYKKAKLLNKNVKLNDVKTFLKNQEATQLIAKQPVGKKLYKPIYVNDEYGYQMDLTFLPRYKYQNEDNYVLFTAININSRYAYAYYGKDKEEKTIIDMLDKFKKNALVINTITSDSGSEFISKAATKWFEDNEIKTFFVVGDSHKLGIVNRFHRTLKEKLLKYFLAYDTVKWIDVIDKIIKSYNNTPNRGIFNYTPRQASKPVIQSYIINDAIERSEKANVEQEEKFKIGDYCRIRNKKILFQKLQTEYTKEIYIIHRINKNNCDLFYKGDIYTVKKEDILIIKDVQSYTPAKNNNNPVINPNRNNTISEAEKVNKIIRLTKKAGVSNSNIIEAPRVRRPNPKYL